MTNKDKSKHVNKPYDTVYRDKKVDIYITRIIQHKYIQMVYYLKITKGL